MKEPLLSDIFEHYKWGRWIMPINLYALNSISNRVKWAWLSTFVLIYFSIFIHISNAYNWILIENEWVFILVYCSAWQMSNLDLFRFIYRKSCAIFRSINQSMPHQQSKLLPRFQIPKSSTEYANHSIAQKSSVKVSAKSVCLDFGIILLIGHRTHLTDTCNCQLATVNWQLAACGSLLSRLIQRLQMPHNRLSIW